MLPEGNGYFIWMMNRVANGDPALMAKMAKEAGLSWVALKIADGPDVFWYNKNNAGVDILRPAVDAFRSVGVRVFGWHYVYSYAPEAEAAVAERQMKTYGLDGYISDPESQYKNRQAAAVVYMRKLRQGLKDFSIGLCTYRFPTYHPEFPWREFRDVDFNMPQVYWMGGHNAGQQVRRSVAEYNALGYKAPIFPAGAAFTEAGWRPTVTEIADFKQTVAAMGLPGYGWWEWYFATVRIPEFWSATAGEYKAQPVAVIPKKTYVSTRFIDLRMRSLPSLSGAILGYLPANQKFELLEESGNWGRIQAGSPTWVNLGYVTKVQE